MGSEQQECGKSTELCAVVTGANKGIGLATVRLLANQPNITVILTSRDQSRGHQALQSLHQEFGLTNVIYHQLNVCNSQSVSDLAHFIAVQFGKLDILVNNAGASGQLVDEEKLKALNIDPEIWLSGKAVALIQDAIRQTYEGAVGCLETNYYGCKRVTEALLPLLQLSTSGARIVNVSSLRSELKRIPGEKIRQELSDIENLNEERIDKLLQRFLDDLKAGQLEAGGWTTMLPSYSISKQVLNAYTRVLARRYPKMYINCVHPGYVKTDINWNTGIITTEEGARGPVMLALLSDGGPTGFYFDQTNIAEF